MDRKDYRERTTDIDNGNVEANGAQEQSWQVSALISSGDISSSAEEGKANSVRATANPKSESVCKVTEK